MDSDIVVVGAGIMGATIAQAFRVLQEREVMLIDGQHPLSGTKASGGSVKPSHLTGLDKDSEKLSLDMLDSLWGLEKETFVVRPSGGFLKADVYQIDMDKVFGVEQVLGEVTKIGRKGGVPCVVAELDGRMEVVRCNLLIVAAGMGCSKLIPKMGLDLYAKQGVSFIFPGKLEQAFVQAWAPYKQITVHNFSHNGEMTIWGSDGSALKPDNWSSERTLECRNRIMKAAKLKQPLETVLGLRPFHKSNSKPCYMEELSEGMWVVTGAGKFGGIAAGWASHKLLELCK